MPPRERRLSASIARDPGFSVDGLLSRQPYRAGPALDRLGETLRAAGQPG